MTFELLWFDYFLFHNIGSKLQLKILKEAAQMHSTHVWEAGYVEKKNIKMHLN